MIKSYCLIRNKTIRKDGNIVFENEHSTLNSFMDDAYAVLNLAYPKFHKMDRLSKLGFLAAEVLLKDCVLIEKYNPEDIALVLSNAHASLDTDIRYSESTKTIASPGLFVYTLSNIVAGEICIRHKIKGENAFFISEKFDPELLLNYVSMIQSDSRDQQLIIAGWIDVLDEHHDAFLYLIDGSSTGIGEHSITQLRDFYQ